MTDVVDLKYFDISEFACKCCGDLPQYGMNNVLLQKLDELRMKINAPIIVTSGYRCPEHNAEVGGYLNSQHVAGNAADIYCNALSVEELGNAAAEVGFDAIGRYYTKGFVHVDCRANGTKPEYYTWEEL